MGYNVLQDAFVGRVQGNPGSVAPGRRLVEDRERVGVGVEKVGHDEGSEVPREYSEVDHDPLQVVVEVSTKQWADRGEGDGEYWVRPLMHLYKNDATYRAMRKGSQIGRKQRSAVRLAIRTPRVSHDVSPSEAQKPLQVSDGVFTCVLEAHPCLLNYGYRGTFGT